MSFRTSSALVLLATLAACTSGATLDICGRGDRVDLPGGLLITFYDASERPLATITAAADRPTTLPFEIPDGAVYVGVDGLGGSPDEELAGGWAAVTRDGACVCLTAAGQWDAVCDGITCQVANGRCVFVDAETGQPAGARTLAFGENDRDDVRGVTSDTYLAGVAGYTGQNFGQDDAVEVDGSPTVGLVRFDLVSLPSTAIVESAQLLLHVVDVPGAESPAPLELAPIREEWAEGLGDGAPGCASWTCRLPDTPWTDPGCGVPTSRDQTPVAGVPSLERAATYPLETPELTALVQAWVAGDIPNFGLAATCADDTMFVSSQGADGDRPELVITFRL